MSVSWIPHKEEEQTAFKCLNSKYLFSHPFNLMKTRSISELMSGDFEVKARDFVTRELQLICTTPHPKACHHDLAHLIVPTGVVFKRPVTLCTEEKSDQAFKIPVPYHAMPLQIEEITKPRPAKQMCFKLRTHQCAWPLACNTRKCQQLLFKSNHLNLSSV